ncbi:hypothetical protein HPC49_35840 [Pyxidicoccus fallax]|uniref:MoxR-vWA-beta-propeller ternary system domain-containing protein n=1 Tax=Pyxidicoccus fallax TaxID=394095 RepID=A0A848LTQ1_9BACT|nr:bpX6 domain-containing protein [Pyxidicoccus fallax]NMO20982.1 hypothetical protein [Pyxidicoccus fallax]NPC83583.1 hypothetical protein [Pyxidicoccus fallax]
MSGASSSLRPRLHLHRGTVRAAALWFDPTLLGEGEARRRVLAAWSPAASVHAVAGGYLLRLPQPRALASDAAPGLPLTLERGVLSSAPLSATEREHLTAGEGSVVLVRAGVARVHPLSGAPAVDLSEWLDVSGWLTVPVRGLGAPPPPVPTLEPVSPPARASYGSVPPLSPEARAMMARMQGKAPPEEVVVARRPGLLARLRAAFLGVRGATPAPRDGRALAVHRAGLLARLRAALSGRASAAGGASRPGLPRRLSSTDASGSDSALATARPGLLARLAAWFQRGEAQPRALSSSTARPAGNGPRSSASTSRRPSLLRRWLSSLFTRSGAEPGSAMASTRGGSTEVPPGTRVEPPGPSLMSRMSEWMLRHTPLGELLGRRKAEYVRRLFEMFEDGDLQEALRHAIPLGSGMPDENTRVALGLPGPRETLSIRTSSAGHATLFGSGQEVFAALKARYLEAFRRLEREGRIDEAAFVLAELLGASEQAVSFLERHGRLRLAAELAESRNLPPGLVVRQWFLAKDVARATAIARRSGAFADAVLRLSNTHPQEAIELRRLWAESLAEAGDWAQAVRAIWPVTEARHLARAWVERGAECGGANGARMLALWASAFPDGLETAGARVRELLEDDSPERAPERYDFGLTLSGEASSPNRSALLVPTARALLRDSAARRAGFPPDFITRLLHGAPDGTLRADLPPLPNPPYKPWHFVATVRASDAGPLPIHDAVALPDGRLLLALGEAGARLVRADGRTVAHFDVPAFSLVSSVNGDRALALAPRGEVWRLSRLDLLARRATAWCDARLDSWASTYDGSTWFAAFEGTVMMVDALAADLRSLWRVPELPGRVLAFAVDATRLSFLTHGGADVERWTYELAQGPTLRARGEVPKPPTPGKPFLMAASLTADGEAVTLVGVLPEQPPEAAPSLTHEVWLRWLSPTTGRKPWLPTDQREGREDFILTESWRADVVRRDEHWWLHLSGVHGGERATLTFEGAAPRVRLTTTSLLAFDSLGRLLVLDMEQGTLQHVAVT